VKGVGVGVPGSESGCGCGWWTGLVARVAVQQYSSSGGSGSASGRTRRRFNDGRICVSASLLVLPAFSLSLSRRRKAGTTSDRRDLQSAGGGAVRLRSTRWAG